MGQSTYLFKKNSGKEKNISNFEKDYLVQYVLCIIPVAKFMKEKSFSHFVAFFLFLEYKSTQYQNMTERSFQSNNHNIFILLRCSRCICTNTIHIHEAKRLEWMVIEQWTLLQMVNNYIIRQCTKQMEQLGLSGGSRARRRRGDKHEVPAEIHIENKSRNTTTTTNTLLLRRYWRTRVLRQLLRLGSRSN